VPTLIFFIDYATPTTSTDNTNLSLHDALPISSSIHLAIDQSKLYEFQIAYAKLDPLIKILLRMYGGELFVAHVPIQESVLANARSEEHTSELQSRENLVCRLLLEKKKRDCHDL